MEVSDDELRSPLRGRYVVLFRPETGLGTVVYTGYESQWAWAWFRSPVFVDGTVELWRDRRLVESREV